MGNSQEQLLKAKQQIEHKIGMILRSSCIYETAAWGNVNQPNFLNQVIIVQSSMNAAACMQQLLLIEKKMGRIRTVKNAPRVIDLDILFHGKNIIESALIQIPHPRIADRRFVLIPLNELSPHFKHPVAQKSIHQLLQSCTDKLDVKKF